MFNCLCINDLFALQRYKNFWTFLLFSLCFKALSTIYMQVGNFSNVRVEFKIPARFGQSLVPQTLSTADGTFFVELSLDGKTSTLIEFK